MPLYPIVGAHYRPPAKALIAGIEIGTKLHLRAEPTNPFDPNAIQVILLTNDILSTSYEALNEELSGYGKDIQDIQATDEWHLGYIPKETAKSLREQGLVQPNKEYEGEFNLNFTGKPQISIDL